MSFPLIGCDRLRESISSLIASGRMPHAIILEGEAGTGKRTLAKYIAKAFVCKNDCPPCEDCRDCHLAEVGTHPDIEWIAPEEKKKNISVDKIRALKELSYTSAHSAEGRVFIIEKADTMNAPSQNSLLKVLEEPPAKLLFILLSESSNKLLQTVVSRCAVFSLFPPSVEEGVELLLKQGVKQSDAEKALRSEQGNIGKALAVINGNKKNRSAKLAEEYLENILCGNSYDALLCTVKMEKDRQLANDFIFQLKELVVSKLKASASLPCTAKELANIYDIVIKAEPSLITNINLSLFFAYLTSNLIAKDN